MSTFGNLLSHHAFLYLYYVCVAFVVLELTGMEAARTGLGTSNEAKNMSLGYMLLCVAL